MGEAKRRGTREERVKNAQHILALQMEAIRLRREEQRAEQQRLWEEQRAEFEREQQEIQRWRQENPELAEKADAADLALKSKVASAFGMRRRGKSMFSGSSLASVAAIAALASVPRERG